MHLLLLAMHLLLLAMHLLLLAMHLLLVTSWSKEVDVSPDTVLSHHPEDQEQDARQLDGRLSGSNVFASGRRVHPQSDHGDA